MNSKISSIQQKIEPLRQQIINHKVYSILNDLEDLKTFMNFHVYAVWDFMSLLKALQNNLTCVTVPWFPKGDAETRYLINEIVAGEESDIDHKGERKSHFELYLEAMKQCNASTQEIESFTNALMEQKGFEVAFNEAGTPQEARDFVEYTFKIISSNKPYLHSAIFTFGREDLIPGMFMAIINDMHQNFPENISIFKYYLERHIEVDGDHHSHLALQMTANLCGDNETIWNESEEAIIKSLQMRIKLWDGVYKQIIARKPPKLD